MVPLEIEKDIRELELMIGNGNMKSDSVLPGPQTMTKAESLGYCLGLIVREFADLRNENKTLNSKLLLLQRCLDVAMEGLREYAHDTAWGRSSGGDYVMFYGNGGENGWKLAEETIAKVEALK